MGNKASNFPLQLLGFDVDPLHSCQLSNHTNYPSFSGYKTRADDVSKIWSGLLANRMLQQYTHLLTGYMTSVEFIEECVGKIEQLKRERPELLFGTLARTPLLFPSPSLRWAVLCSFVLCFFNVMILNNQSTFVLLTFAVRRPPLQPRARLTGVGGQLLTLDGPRGRAGARSKHRAGKRCNF